jgi:hypothetical protein
MKTNPNDPAMKQVTQEIKEAYFALYHAQRVATYDSDDEDRVWFYVSGEIGRSKFMYLHLRPITALTDAEAIEVAKICGYGKNRRTLDAIKREGDKGFSVIDLDEESHIEIDLEAYDYLRSIGIALPFRGFAVAELQEAGVLKLVEISETSTSKP